MGPRVLPAPSPEDPLPPPSVGDYAGVFSPFLLAPLVEDVLLEDGPLALKEIQLVSGDRGFVFQARLTTGEVIEWSADISQEEAYSVIELGVFEAADRHGSERKDAVQAVVDIFHRWPSLPRA